MTQPESCFIDFNLVDQVVKRIPNHTWPAVKEAVIVNIVDLMPSNILFDLTGDEQAFEKAEEILTNYYAPENRNYDLIVDAFKIIGEDNTLYMLDALQLEKIQAPQDDQNN